LKFISTSNLSRSQKEQIYHLWNAEYPQDISYHTLIDFDRYLNSLVEKSHVLLLDEMGQIVGWYVDFIRENEKWFAMVLNVNFQGDGWGREFLKLAKEKENNLNAWVIDHDKGIKLNGKPYKSPVDFYLNNGFHFMSGTRLELHNISAVKMNWSK